MKFKIYILVILFFALFGWTNSAFAGTYWVSSNGTEVWANCQSLTPLSGTAACSLSTANANAFAGDTVYFRAGTYTITGNGIAPTNSGSVGNMITFSGYEDEVATIAGDPAIAGASSRGIYLSSDSYVKVTKLAFSNLNLGCGIHAGGHNEISYCTFAFRDVWADGGVYSYDPSAVDIGGNSTHNWIHHCTVHGYGAFDEGDRGTLFSIGFTSSETEENSNNTIEYNHIYHGGHHVFAVNSGFYNVVRKNYFHNEGWFDDSLYDAVCAAGDNGVCGYRVLYMAGHEDHVGYNFYEGNNISYGAQYGAPHVASGGSGNGFTLGNSNNIVRYNTFIANAQYGLGFGNSLSATEGFGYGKNNRVYNNTFLSNGYNWPSEDDAKNVDSWRTGIHFYQTSGITGNVIKNNLFHDNWALTHRLTQSVYYPDINALSAENVANNTIASNYTTDDTYLVNNNPFTNTSDPKFINETLPADSTAIITAWSDYAVTTPDLRLQIDSPVINQGVYLTQASGSGFVSTSLIVADARYFQDGTWGSQLATLEPDWVAVGTIDNVHQIDSINYTNNTITLSDIASWSNGANVWLYKKSDGSQVLYGSAPEYGAYEFAETSPDTTPPSAPSNLAVQ